MIRRNPDAIALVVIAVVMFIFSVPRMFIQDAKWRVTPVKAELALQRAQLEAVRDGIRAHEAALKAAAQSIREAVR